MKIEPTDNTPNDRLKESPDAEILRLCEAGDSLTQQGHLEQAIAHYTRALERLPAPIEEQQAGSYILAAIGNTYFLQGEYTQAYRLLQHALRCPKGDMDALLHLRIGQVFLQWENEDLAAKELAMAYMMGGTTIFDGEDPKYFALVKSVLRTPANGVW